MNRIYLIAVFLICMVGQLQAQNTGYFDEAVKIAHLKDDRLHFVFHIEPGAIPRVTGADQYSVDWLTTVQNNLLTFYNKAQPSAIPGAQGDVGQIQGSGADIASQNGQSPARPGGNPLPVYQRLTLNTQNNIKNDLNYILFLLYDNSEADYEMIAPTFPKSFKYLGDRSLYLFNASEAATSFNFPQIALAITDLIAKKAKKELVSHYLDVWRTDLTNNPIVEPLIPQTLNVFAAFNTNSSLNLADYGEKWKAAFQEDLRNIPVVLQDETYTDRVMSLTTLSMTNQKEAASAISGAALLVSDLYQKQHLVNILNDVAAKYINAGDQALYKRVVVLSSLVAKFGGSMQNNVYKGFDLSQVDITVLPVFMKILFLRDLPTLEYAFKESNAATLFNALSDVPRQKILLNFIQQGVSALNTYQDLVSSKAQQSTVTLSFDDARNLFDLTFKLIDEAKGIMELYGNDKDWRVQLGIDYTSIKICFQELAEIGEGVTTRQYGKVLDGTAGVMTQILTATNSTDQRLRLSVQYIQVFGSFMLNILNAKSTSDVEAALDDLLPDGQYDIKNKSRYSFSVCSYPGLFAGLESLSNPVLTSSNAGASTPPKLSGVAFSPAVFLPIGIDVSFGHKLKKDDPDSKKPRYDSWNVFLQVVDFGAILDYRIGGGVGENTAPNFSLRQLFSPGISFIYHVPDSPIVVGAGANFLPALRNINQNGNTYQANAFRFGMFVSVDVTFFNFLIHKFLK